jgi:hypothetical protein
MQQENGFNHKESIFKFPPGGKDFREAFPFQNFLNTCLALKN